MELSIVIKPCLGFLFQVTCYHKFRRLHWTFQDQLTRLAMENGLGLKLHFRIEHGDIPASSYYVTWIYFLG